MNDSSTRPTQQAFLRIVRGIRLCVYCVSAFELFLQVILVTPPGNRNGMAGSLIKTWIPLKITFFVKCQRNIAFFPGAETQVNQEQTHETQKPRRMEDVGAAVIHPQVVIGSDQGTGDTRRGDKCDKDNTKVKRGKKL